MHTRAAWSRALLIAIAFWAVARPAFAQSAECVSSDCPAAAAPVSAQDIWLAASRIHEIKLQFVEALRRFTEAQAGTFGDEGPVLRREPLGDAARARPLG